MTNQEVFERLWEKYRTLTPQAEDIKTLFEERGETVVNDHIALRTFNDSRVSIDQLSQIFLRQGYQQRGEYRFENKKLTARHFEHPDRVSPKVFISQLELQKCSDFLRETAEHLINQVDPETWNEKNMVFCGQPWTLDFTTYEKLYRESEYAAWLSAFGYCANHFTVDLNRLHTFKNIHEINRFLKRHGYILNHAGGEVKGSEEQLLEQSSTLASRIAWQFTDGEHEIPSCYYEFAYRYPLKDGNLFQGFVTASADKIFESTH